jgi:hypothetical protein
LPVVGQRDIFFYPYGIYRPLAGFNPAAQGSLYRINLITGSFATCHGSNGKDAAEYPEKNGDMTIFEQLRIGDGRRVSCLY